MPHIEETRRQIIIAQTFRKGAKLTFSEIKEKLENESIYENYYHNYTIGNKTFERDIDIQEIHKHCFGVSVAKDYKPQKIVLSFSPVAGKYVKSLPWHDSQKILIDNDKELRISLYVYPTDDFKIELLSYGNEVKVFEPQGLSDEIKQTYKDALKQYE